MLSVNALEELTREAPACLTIGAFDGVHRGHQALIGGMAAHAHATGRVAVVVTFYPHPSVVLRGRRPSFYISSLGEKCEQLAALGVDAVVNHPFNREIAEIRAEDFVARLISHARMQELWCSEDFALGRNRQGTVSFLRAYGEQHGFAVRVVPPLLIDGEVISSTRIRQALRDGAVEQVARFLGRPFRLSGQVVEAARRGQTLDMPAAKVVIPEEHAFPAVGVYACRVIHAQGDSLAACNIDSRPIFQADEAQPTLEAHLFDFQGDLSGEAVTLEFLARLRPEVQLSSAEALSSQIRQDIAAARQALAGRLAPE